MNDGEDAIEPTDGPDESDDQADGATEEAAESERKWRFTLEDIREREAAATATEEAEERRNEPIEAGDPSFEGAAFAVLGVVFTLFVISRLFIG